MERIFFNPTTKRLFECAVGLEVHAQITASSYKLFSNALTRAPTSTSSSLTNASYYASLDIEPFDAAHPGTLPRAPNSDCVFHAIRTGLALKGDISKVSSFERKHYNYPDLPHGYQITQLTQPMVTNGHLIFSAPLISQNRHKSTTGNLQYRSRSASCSSPLSGTTRLPSTSMLFQRICGIDQIQLEMDSGKSNIKKGTTSSNTLIIDGDDGNFADISPPSGLNAADKTSSTSLSWLVDFKRAGVALLEIVSKPDLRSPEEAANYLKSLIALLKRIEVNDGMLEEGALRCDVNVSIRPVDEEYIQELERIEVAPFLAENSQLSMSSSTLPSVTSSLSSAFKDELHSKNSNDSTTSSSSRNLSQVLDFRRRNLHNFGQRVEMKNLSSIRAVYRAVEHETERQISLFESGQSIDRETRSFDFLTRTSARLRSKSTLMDYRFMPEPDLAPLIISDELINRAKASLPELPSETIERLILKYALPNAIASTLVTMNDDVDKILTVAFFEDTVKNSVEVMMGNDSIVSDVDEQMERKSDQRKGTLDNEGLNLKRNEWIRKMARPVANWILNDFSGLLRKAASSPTSSSSSSFSTSSTLSSNSPSSSLNTSPLSIISAKAFGELIALVEGGQLSGKRGKAILTYIVTGEDTGGADFKKMNHSNSVFSRSLSPREIAQTKGWITMSNTNISGDNTPLGKEKDNERGGGGEGGESERNQQVPQKENENDMTKLLRQRIQIQANALVNDPVHAESVNKWRVKGSDRVHSALVKVLLETSSESASHPRLAAECIKDALGPLGQRDEKPIGRKAARKLAAEEAASKRQQ